KSEMTIMEVTPIFLADGFEDVTYRCKGCRSGHKAHVQTTFRRVGTCHTPKFSSHFAHEAKKENCNRSHWASLTLIHERRRSSEGKTPHPFESGRCRPGLRFGGHATHRHGCRVSALAVRRGWADPKTLQLSN